MTLDETLAFLDEKPRGGHLVFTSMGPRGYPHSVPLLLLPAWARSW